MLFVWVLIIQIKLCDLSNEAKHKNPEFNDDNSDNLDNISDIPYQDFENNNDNICNNNQSKAIAEEISDKISFVLSDEYDTKSESFNFESAFLGNIFSKVGATALIIGIIIFIKLVSSYIDFTPAIKIFLGYFTGVILLICGYKLKDEKLKGYKETLLGTGISVAFISTYCASALFKLFSPLMAIIFATIILICLYIIADKQKTVSMVTIALIAGYLNPVLSDANASCEFLFGYYIFINLLSAIYTFKNPNHDVINFINLIMTSLVLTIAQINNHSVNIIYPLLLWLVYIVYDLFRKEKNSLHTDKNNILNWTNFGILTLFTAFHI